MMKKLLLSVLAIGGCFCVTGMEYMQYRGPSRFEENAWDCEEQKRIEKERCAKKAKRLLAAKQKKLVVAYTSWRLKAASERDKGKPITPWQPPE